MMMLFATTNFVCPCLCHMHSFPALESLPSSHGKIAKAFATVRYVMSTLAVFFPPRRKNVLRLAALGDAGEDALPLDVVGVVSLDVSGKAV